MGFWAWLFGEKRTAQALARERLRVVLMQDRGIIPAPLMEKMRREILEVVSRYADVSDDGRDINVDKHTPRKGGKYQ